LALNHLQSHDLERARQTRQMMLIMSMHMFNPSNNQIPGLEFFGQPEIKELHGMMMIPGNIFGFQIWTQKSKNAMKRECVKE
jgi:hypothetical protein